MFGKKKKKKANTAVKEKRLTLKQGSRGLMTWGSLTQDLAS